MNVSTENQEKLKEFKPGTQFVSAFGAKDVVADPVHTYWSGGCLFIKGQQSFRLIYDGNWAEIIQNQKR